MIPEINYMLRLGRLVSLLAALQQQQVCFILGVSLSSSIIILLGGAYNFYRLYCSNYQRPTIFCQLWVNEQSQGTLVFSSSVAYSDNSADTIMIPPSTCGTSCVDGSLRQFLIARNHTTIYPTSEF